MHNSRISKMLMLLFCTSCFAAPASAAEPKLVWKFETPQSLPVAIAADALKRPYLYVALKNGGLGVLKVAKNGSSPKQIARIGLSKLKQMDVMNLMQHGKYLYLALGGHFTSPGTKHAGLAIVDVANPSKPRVVSVWKSKQKLQGSAVVVTDGTFVYIGAMSAGVMTFDVSNAAKIRHLSTFLPDVNFPRKNPGRVQHPNARGMSLKGNLLFVCNDAGGLRVLDMKDRTHPKEIGRYINKGMTGKQQAYNNIVINGDRAYIAIDYAGLEIVDISNPRKIKQIGWWNPWEAHTLKNLWFNSPGHTNQIAFDATRKLVYLSAGDSELQVVNVAKPSNPKLVSQFGKPKNKIGVWGLTISDDQVFLTYIKTPIPFRGTWSGIKAVSR